MSHLSFDINENGDFYLRNGRLALVRDNDALATVCTQVASARKGEILFYENRGIPFFETIWKGSPNLRQYEAAVISSLLEIDGVLSVPQIVAIIENEEVKYSALVETIYGETKING